MNPTLNQRRFLTVWILFHSFALFVNLAPIKGEYKNDSTPIGNDIRYLFTNKTNENSFWPFTTYNHYQRRIDTISKYQKFEGKLYKSPINETTEFMDHYYNGVFNSYGFTEFIFYILLGIGFIYVPKIWTNM